ncbi:MAG: MFS transporter [Chloroflexi bacterium]|nr:MFS transporter [Chloroflexota bacterium]
MFAFTLVVIGQIISLMGSSMTIFALSIWAWQETGQATALALVAFFGFGPTVLLSPIAGALVDRWDRKLVMMLSDLGAGLATIGILFLFISDDLQIWHLYVANGIAGAFQAFQWPAYSAAITTMVPKEQYGRANGMMSIAQPASNIFGPLLAAGLIGVIGIDGIMWIDIVSFSAAIGVLLWVFIPNPERTEEGQEGSGSLWKESLYGFRYILQRPPLFWLQMIFFFLNFTGSISFVLVTPMVLARTGNNEIILGTVMSLGSIGGLLGGLAMSAWGGPKRRIHGVLLGMLFSSLLGQMAMGLPFGLWAWGFGSFMTFFMIMILNGSNQAIWQSKVAPDVQGRVFAVRRLIAQAVGPIAMLLGGPAADAIFEPAMAEGGSLAGTFGWLVGTGPGAGMGLMFVLFGGLGVLISLSGYVVPIVRNVEDVLPDHDYDPAAVAPQEGSEEAALASEGVS